MADMKKVAIVYDWIDKWGGVERILLVLHQIFKEGQFYTSYFDKEKASWAKDLSINTSFIQKLPSFIRKNRILSFPFYPFAFESFDFSQYNLVISVTSSFAKAIITKPGTRHICYLLTPTRYLWVMPEVYQTPSISYIKRWDYVASKRPDKIISISQTVADRCRQYYGRVSEVIYPPFDIDYWSRIKSQISNDRLIKKVKSQINLKFKNNKDFFLVVSRLEAYKKVDLVIEVFNILKKNLAIVGEGSREKEFKKKAKGNIIFFSRLTDFELGWLYNHASGLIMPQEEDFGYVALESQFFGCPVIAYNKGGATETVLNEKTGLFFNNQTKDDLLGVLERFYIISYNLKTQVRLLDKKYFKKFSKTNFIEKFQSLL